MTVFILSLLAVISIVLIARYYGSSELATNLLLTFAFSVFVGLSIRYYTRDNISSVSKNVITENVMTVDSTSMQMVLPALEPVNTQSSVGQTENHDVVTFVQLPNKLTYNSFWNLLRKPILFDSS